MVLVIVRYKKALEPFLPDLGWLLPKVVARELSVEGTAAELHPDEVKVEFREFGPYDVSQENRIVVTVIANEYPERLAILEKAKEALKLYVIQVVNRPGVNRPGVNRAEFGVKGAVWVLLAKGAWAEW